MRFCKTLDLSNKFGRTSGARSVALLFPFDTNQMCVKIIVGNMLVPFHYCQTNNILTRMNMKVQIKSEYIYFLADKQVGNYVLFKPTNNKITFSSTTLYEIELLFEFDIYDVILKPIKTPTSYYFSDHKLNTGDIVSLEDYSGAVAVLDNDNFTIPGTTRFSDFIVEKNVIYFHVQAKTKLMEKI